MYSFGRSIVRYNDMKFVSGNSDPMVSLFPKVMISKGKDYLSYYVLFMAAQVSQSFLLVLPQGSFNVFSIEHYRPVSGSLFQNSNSWISILYFLFLDFNFPYTMYQISLPCAD